MVKTMTNPELREALAEYAHEAWSGWMRYMFSKCKSMSGLVMQAGHPDAIIPGHLVERWIRQMNAPYAELPESEKESDRAEADKMLAIITARSGE